MAGIGGLFDIEMTPANMMVVLGASGASSSGVNQAPLPPVLQPQPPMAELDGGGKGSFRRLFLIVNTLPWRV